MADQRINDRAAGVLTNSIAPARVSGHHEILDFLVASGDGLGIGGAVCEGAAGCASVTVAGGRLEAVEATWAMFDAALVLLGPILVELTGFAAKSVVIARMVAPMTTASETTIPARISRRFRRPPADLTTRIWSIAAANWRPVW